MFYCLKCGNNSAKVIDSRLTTGSAKRRRRKCEVCGCRFTTYEEIRKPTCGVIGQLREALLNVDKIVSEALRR